MYISLCITGSRHTPPCEFQEGTKSQNSLNIQSHRHEWAGYRYYSPAGGEGQFVHVLNNPEFRGAEVKFLSLSLHPLLTILYCLIILYFITY